MTTNEGYMNMHDELRDIQGGAIGFLKDHQRLIFLNFNDVASGKAFITEIEPTLANGMEVRRFNEAFSENRRHNGDPDALQSTWVNIWLSHTGLSFIAAPGLEAFPPEFSAGMGARANVIGDLGASAPATWQAPFTGGTEPHAVILLAGDNLADLETRRAKVEEVLGRHNIVIVGRQDGDARPAPFTGHEHFGFKDGVSQPGIDRFTKADKGGHHSARRRVYRLSGFRGQRQRAAGHYPGPGAHPIRSCTDATAGTTAT